MEALIQTLDKEKEKKSSCILFSWSLISLKNVQGRASKMAQKVKVIAAKPDSLSFF